MRIPTRKIYRAFPELDQFSDEQCERFMQRLRVSGARNTIPQAVFVAVTVVGLAIACSASSFVFAVLEDELQSRRNGDVHSIYDFVVLLIGFGLPVFLGLIARDFTLRRHLKLVINEKLDRIRCLACKYILIGQVVHENQVTCPECGSVMPLDQLGIVAEDLIPPDMNDPTGHSFV